MSRCHNFSAGPSALPLSVIMELQEALPLYKNTRVGLMEMSHRSPDFQQIIDSARNRMRGLMKIPDDYEILFLQGGASLQFHMLALNLLCPEDRGGYVLTGVWSKKALKEAQRSSKSEGIWTSEGFKAVPKTGDFKSSTNATFLHYTSNNTIYGTQFHAAPVSEIPLIADMSSDICCRPVNVAAHDLIYAGAQKNLGPSGVTAIILSPWAVSRSQMVDANRPGGLPSMLNYALMVEKDSMFNTPNTFGIFALDRMFKWMEDQGGLESIETINRKKAALIYDALDSSDFWVPYSAKDSRSWMNITWNIADRTLEGKFIADADKAGLKALKGHRSIGGIRASIYNACGIESVKALVRFMEEFASKH